ncbi:MAG: prepilin-type N-terminal cleavage/methylation domain-containing protein [Deltaproteobacteria bacterium]|nr:MAG: prepilin-type N-terminal cleavage/methylation domain-containing protein [Deltaproteobacteria bacterium]
MVKRAAKGSTRTSTRATSNRPDRRRPVRPRAGFTLIELAVVLVILSTLVSLVWPRLSLLEHGRLDHSGRKLAAMLAYVQDEASLRGRTYRVVLDLDAGRYRVETETRTPSGEISFSEQWDDVMKAVRLPDGVRITAVETDHARYVRGEAELFFLPEDATPEVRITLESAAGERRELIVEGGAGRVRLEAPEVRG